MEPRHTRAWIAVGGLVVTLAVLAGAARGIVPSPDFALEVDVAQDGRTLTYTIHFDNVGAAPSARVVITDEFPAGSTYLGDASDLTEGVWTRAYENVTAGPHVASVSVRLADTVPDGARMTNVVVLRYTDAMGSWTTKSYETEYAVAFRAAATPGYRRTAGSRSS